MTADAALAVQLGIAVGDRLFTDVADRIDLNGLPRFTLARRAGGTGPAPVTQRIACADGAHRGAGGGCRAGGGAAR